MVVDIETEEGILELFNSIKSVNEALLVCRFILDDVKIDQLNNLDIDKVNLPYVRILIREYIEDKNIRETIRFLM